MNYLKSLFTSTPQQQTRSLIDKYLSSISLSTRTLALPLTFQHQLTTSIALSASPTLYMKELAHRLTTTRTVSATVKLFTVVHNGIYERDYDKEELEGIEQLPVPQMDDPEEAKWFGEFATNYCSYLRKLPSVGDVYRRAKLCKPQGKEQQEKSIYLVEVFRIINQIGMLFPHICIFTNQIGRYYLSSYPQFPQFYRMINKQVMMVYAYMKLMIDQILSSYRGFDVQLLKCFMKTIPEIELTCDKMEDLLLNKYFKGKSIKAKIYFKEEKVQEVCYYLDYQLEGRLVGDYQEKHEEDREGETKGSESQGKNKDKSKKDKKKEVISK